MDHMPAKKTARALAKTGLLDTDALALQIVGLEEQEKQYVSQVREKDPVGNWLTATINAIRMTERHVPYLEEQRELLQKQQH